MSYHEVRRIEFLLRPSDLPAAQILAPVAAYEIGLEAAEVAGGNLYWRVVGIHHLSPDENRGGHAAFIDVVDEDSRRVEDASVRIAWGWEGQQPEESSEPKRLDKPPHEPATNIDLFPNQKAWIRVEGDGTPSDRVFNLHSKHADEPGPNGENWNSVGHHSFYVLFQRTRKAASGPVTEPIEEPIEEPVAPAPPAPEPGPVTPPAPSPPVPTPAAGNRLGFYLHMSTDQHGLWESIRRVQPPVILIHADTANRTLLQEIRAFRAPDAFVIGRMFKDVNTQRQMLEGPDPAGAGRAMAEEIVNYDFGLATQTGENGRLLIDAWMSLNEAVPGPASRQYAEHPEATARLLAAYDAFQTAFQERLRQAGIESVAFNFGAGNFSRPEHYLDHFPTTLAACTYLGFHEYGWPALQPGPGIATSATLYRACMEGIRARFGNRHRAIITEAGLTRMYADPTAGDVGWLNGDEPLAEDDYWRSLEWYNRQLSQDDYVLGACLYEVGHHGSWETFRHLGPDSQGRPLQLIEKIAALNSTPRTRQAQPFQTAMPPQPVTIRGTVTGSGAPLAGATVRLVGGQETLGTVREAAVLTTSSVTWTRAITGFEGSIAQAWRKFMSDGTVPLSWPHFRERMAQYNPSLRETKGTLRAGRRYKLPEVRDFAGEIVWDRPLTGFSGSVVACWRRYVARKVVGLTYADFKRDVVRHNLKLTVSGLQFEANTHYNLPRNADQKEYVLTARTSTRGGFRFRSVPPGRYRLEIQAEGYLAEARPLDAQSDCNLKIDLTPVVSGFRQFRPRDFLPGGAPEFVRRQGSEFVANGQVLRFVGVNIRGLVHYGDGQTLQHTTHEHRREQIRAARDIGARVIRIFLPCHHVSAQETAVRLQSVIALLREEAPEMYLLPALSNLYNDVPFRVPGDDGFYARIDPNFPKDLLNASFFHGGYQNNFLPFVRNIVQTFQHEPHIFAWEIGNELKLNPATPDLMADPNVAAFLNFMHATAQEIRRIDRNHMVTTGMISTHHAWLHNDELKMRLYSAPSFDFLTVHCYNDELFNDDSELAARLDKPFIVEEAGYDAGRDGNRSDRMAQDMAFWFGRGARGYMPWGFMATANDIGDGDSMSGLDRSLHGDWEPLTNLLRQRSEQLMRDAPVAPIVTRPPDPAPAPPAPPKPPVIEIFQAGQTVFSRDWVNVRKSAGFLNKLGDDILGMVSPGSAVSIIGEPVIQDGLTWYPIRGSLADGSGADGWVAAATNAVVLLTTDPPPARSFTIFGARSSRTPSSGTPRTAAMFRAESRFLFAAAFVNLRHTPGYVGKPSDDVIGQIPRGARVEILGAPTSADNLTWWPLRAPLLDNSIAVGWAAEIDPDGTRLLDSEAPAPPPSFSGEAHGTPIRPGDTLVVLNAANLRPVATLGGEASPPILATLAANSHVNAVGGPELADGLEWWRVALGIGDASPQPGWMALVSPDGWRILVPASVAERIHVGRPFQDTWPMTQGWGTNPDVYAQFKYDGVPLKGHNGLDFWMPVGTPLLAIDHARVIRVGYEPDGFGHFVVLRHAWGESLYAHLSRVDVAHDAQLTEGQEIGLSGESGFRTGPHLHFGVRIFPYRRTDGWGGFVNPLPFMAQERLALPSLPVSDPPLMAPELAGRLRP